MKKLALAALLAATAIPLSASADQCAFVSHDQADDAVALLDVGASIVSFCEPCGDDAPQSVQIASVSAADTGFEGFWEVSVNGAGIDLAYTFIENGDGTYVNLSKMVDCPSEGVSCMLDGALNVLPASGGICGDGGAKEDQLTAEDQRSACSIGGKPGTGGPLFGLLLGLAGLVAARRRR